MPVHIQTPWTALKPPSEPLTDQERHDLFVRHVREVADHKTPYLFPLLEACYALVYVQQGQFMFGIGNPQRWYEVPELSQSITVLPWAEEATRQQ